MSLYSSVVSVVMNCYHYFNDRVEFHWTYQSALVNSYIKTNNSQVARFLNCRSGQVSTGGTGLIVTIIGIVIAFKVFMSIMPETISDAKFVTENETGAGYNWDAGEKSMWGVISLLMIVFGIFIALSAMRQRG